MVVSKVTLGQTLQLLISDVKGTVLHQKAFLQKSSIHLS